MVSALADKTADPGVKSQAPLGGAWKRAMDIVIAASALIVAAPLMFFVASIVLIDMGWPIFFIQSRVGFGGRNFGCLKFRTMTKGAQHRLESVLAASPKARAEWDATQKLTSDPRVTCLGRALRKSSLDELPQLFNILAGDMSCVGPRPVTPPELERYGRDAAAYLAVRPGLTGLWQVSGRSAASYSRRVTLDRIYARRLSVRLDLRIMLKTIPAILRTGETA